MFTLEWSGQDWLAVTVDVEVSVKGGRVCVIVMTAGCGMVLVPLM